MEEDVVSENSYDRLKQEHEKQLAKAARSYVSRSDEENWDELSENEKKEFREVMKKNLSYKPKKENYIKKGKKFTD